MWKGALVAIVLAGIASVISFEIDLTENAEVGNTFDGDGVAGLVKKGCTSPKCQKSSRQRQLRLLHSEGGKPCGRYCTSWKRSQMDEEAEFGANDVEADDRLRREWYDQALQNCKPYCKWLKRRSRSMPCKPPFCTKSISADVDKYDNEDDDDSNSSRRALIGLPYCLPLCQGRD